MDIWSVLDISPTGDMAEIKRAYARQLKLTRPDQDPQGYQRLREAFEAAKSRQASGKATEEVSAEKNVQIIEKVANPLAEQAQDSDWFATFKQELDDKQRQRIVRNADEIAELLLENEYQGLVRLEEYLENAEIASLALHEFFSHRLGEALSQQAWLDDMIVKRVSVLMGWDLDNYHTHQLPQSTLYALDQQVRRTDNERYWASLRAVLSHDFYDRTIYRLLTQEGARIPIWARCLPGFAQRLERQINIIKYQYPDLINRINSKVVNYFNKERVMVTWGAVFSAVFWFIVVCIPTAKSEHVVRDRLMLAGGLVFFMYISPLCQWALSSKPRARGGFRLFVSVLSSVVILKTYSLFYLLGRTSPEPPTVQIATILFLTVIVGAVIWAVLPKNQKWCLIPSSIIDLAINFPLNAAKTTGLLTNIGVILMILIVYCLTLDFALYGGPS